MTDTASLSPREVDEAVAAEYVVGVQSLAERSAAETRIRTDAAFAAMVGAWEFRLADMNDGYAEVKAPNLLPAIEARLFPKASVPAQLPLRERFSPLRWLSGMALAASVVIVGLTLAVPPRPDLVAVLATTDARLSYEVHHFGQQMMITRVAGVPAVSGQVHELWIIAPNSAPVSLGLLQDQPLVIDYPVPPAGWVLAVSVEPEGGSPEAGPTGPVILTAEVGTTDA
jgi:anti-sigma-K factor RskA